VPAGWDTAEVFYARHGAEALVDREGAFAIDRSVMDAAHDAGPGVAVAWVCGAEGG
jgi:hypothetical protein